MKLYHCFWINPYGHESCYENFSEIEPVLELVKRNELGKDHHTDVSGLRVIFGSEVEFEPATVIQTYRVKLEMED